MSKTQSLKSRCFESKNKNKTKTKQKKATWMWWWIIPCYN